MRKKLIKETLWDTDNLKAVSGWADMYSKTPNNDYTIVVNEPFIIETDNDKDAASLKYVLNKYRIKFEYDEKRKK